LRIGLHRKNYGYARVLYGDPPPPVEFVDVPSFTLWKLPQLPKFLQWARVFSPYPKVDFLHTYNHLVLNNRPWVISFESFLPRFQSSMKNRKAWAWGLEKLVSDNCKRIIPISLAAKRLFYLLAEENGFRKELFDHKVEVIYPAVDVSSFNKKKHPRKGGPIRFLFVGNLFFTKGGRPLLKAFIELSKHYDIEMTVISTVTLPDFFFQCDESDRLNAIKQMTTHNKITWRQNVPNVELSNYYYSNSDIFLLPTLQDTFGFVNIEAMASGLPVISTSQFAVPEQVIHNETGYLINIPLDEMGRLSCIREKNSPQKKQLLLKIEESIYEQLISYLSKLIEDPSKIYVFGKNGLRRAQNLFDVRIRNKALMEIYRTLVGAEDAS